MTSEDRLGQLHEQAEAGRRLKLFAEDPVIQQFFEVRRSRLIEAMVSNRGDDLSALTKSIIEINALDDLRKLLTSITTIGERAERAIAKTQSEKT